MTTGCAINPCQHLAESPILEEWSKVAADMEEVVRFDLTSLGKCAAIALSLGALAGCATPESRVRSGLIEVGLPPPLATCMASRMVDRLSLLQLRRLGRVGTLTEGGVGGLTIDQYLHRARALGDPEIWGVVSSSAAICAIRG